MSKIKEFASIEEAQEFLKTLEGYEVRPLRVGASTLSGINVLSYCLAKPIYIKGVVVNYLEYRS